MKYLLKLSPLIEALLECSLEDHIAAFKEVLLTGIAGFFPLFIGVASILLVSEADSAIGYIDAFRQVVGNGELILYSTSMLAPVLYLVLSEPADKKHMPERMFQGSIVFFILATCYFFYALKYNGNVNNLQLLVSWSYYLIAISIFVSYLAAVFRNMRIVSDDLKEPEREFMSGYEKHRDTQHED